MRCQLAVSCTSPAGRSATAMGRHNSLRNTRIMAAPRDSQSSDVATPDLCGHISELGVQCRSRPIQSRESAPIVARFLILARADRGLPWNVDFPL